METIYKYDKIIFWTVYMTGFVEPSHESYRLLFLVHWMNEWQYLCVWMWWFFMFSHLFNFLCYILSDHPIFFFLANDITFFITLLHIFISFHVPSKNIFFYHYMKLTWCMLAAFLWYIYVIVILKPILKPMKEICWIIKWNMKVRIKSLFSVNDSCYIF